MSDSLTGKERDRLIAAVLSGSWRHSTTAPQIFPAELEAIAPLLIQSGAGALVWWCIRDCALALQILGRSFISFIGCIGWKHRKPALNSLRGHSQLYTPEVERRSL